MVKKDALYALPLDLSNYYFSHEYYLYCGFMSDWLLNFAKQFDLYEVILDIHNNTYSPEELNVLPRFDELKHIVNVILIENELDSDFIVEAKIQVRFNKEKNELVCHSWIIDKENNRYIVGPLIESAYDSIFDPHEKIKEMQEKSQQDKENWLIGKWKVSDCKYKIPGWNVDPINSIYTFSADNILSIVSGLDPAHEVKYQYKFDGQTLEISSLEHENFSFQYKFRNKSDYQIELESKMSDLILDWTK